MKTQNQKATAATVVVETAKAVTKLKKVVAAVNAGQMSEEVLSPKQKEIVKVVNELTGATPVATVKKKLPTKKELKAAQKAEAAIPMTHDEEIDALVNELNAEPVKPKRRAPKGEILPEVKEPINEKTGKPWAKFGAHGTNHVLEGFETGEKVMFNLKGVQTEGVYSHFHKNNHSPKGYLVIKVGNKIFERVLEKVTKVSAVESVVKATAAKESKSAKKEKVKA